MNNLSLEKGSAVLTRRSYW